jgi:hypothetical protein
VSPPPQEIALLLFRLGICYWQGCPRQASPAIDAALDGAIHAPGAANSSELARTQLQVLYALGVAAEKQYGSRQVKDRGQFDVALQDFRKAWGLRALANPRDQVVFALALYGWGLAMHDRSWIERNTANQRRPDYIRAAQDKFAEFLREVDKSGNSAAYPYPQHIQQARAYVERPELESLQTK